MNKKTIVVVLTLLLLILVGIFYWFEWRPSQIRKNCYASAIKNPFKNPNATESERRSELNFIYQNCLKIKGLEK
ncbi:MAG: hypothetical protein WCV92_05465 [Candidatus Buchananbacteria bacterium]